MPPIRRSILLLGTVILLAGGAAAVGPVDAHWPFAGGEGYQPRPVRAPTTELVFVYVGQAGCLPSNAKPTVRAVRSAKRRLAREAREAGLAFRAVGVAVDQRADVALDHLEKFGAFDEVSAGGGWLNSQAIKYLWRGVPGQPSTPQVALLERQVRVPAVEENVYSFGAGRPSLLRRIVGTNELRRWSERDILLPVEVARDRRADHAR